MEDQINNQYEKARLHSKALFILSSIYGGLYLIFFIVSFLPGRVFGGIFGPEGSPVSSTMPFEPFSLDQIYVKLLFVLFLVGYLVVRKHQGIGGVIFILWWAAVWAVELLIIAPIETSDGGMLIAMGLPQFVFGILFIRLWYKGRKVSASSQK